MIGVFSSQNRCWLTWAEAQKYYQSYCSIKLNWKLTYIHEGVNHMKKNCLFTHFELCSFLHYLNLRKAFHGNHYCKLKTDSQFVNIFNCNKIHTLQWSKIYWSRMKVYGLIHLVYLFDWQYLFVCLITQTVNAPGKNGLDCM